MKIDSHQHFWKYDAEQYGWMGRDMDILKKDYLPDDLFSIIQNTGVEGTVAVQARQNLEETNWLLELAAKHSFIQAVVGWVDLCAADVDTQLTKFSTFKKFAGVRHVLHDEPDDGFMLKEDFLEGISKLNNYNLTYDLLLFPRHLSIACKMVEKYPEQRFVLDHMAKPMIKTGVFQQWSGDMKHLGEFPNVYCKVSGMVTENHWEKWSNSDFDPYLDKVFEVFGWERIMYGSDWPVCTLAAGYDQVYQIVFNYLKRSGLSSQAVDAILGGNALKFYGISF